MHLLTCVVVFVCLLSVCWAGGKTPSPARVKVTQPPPPPSPPPTPKPKPLKTSPPPTPPTRQTPPTPEPTMTPPTTTTTSKPLVKPNITTAARSITIQSGHDIKLTCIGERAMEWEADVVPKMGKTDPNRKITPTFKNGTKLGFTSVFEYKNAKASSTGRYYCSYVGRADVRTSIYVYVTDPAHIFRAYSTAEYENPSDLTYVRVSAGKPVVIPCLITTPDADVSLYKYQQQAISDAPYKPDVGFTVPYGNQARSGIFQCQAEYNGRKTVKKYITFEGTGATAAGPTTVKVGDDVTVTCVAVSKAPKVRNGAQCPVVKWVYTVKQRKTPIVKSSPKCVHYPKEGYIRTTSTIKIPGVKKSDAGSYLCGMGYGPGKRDTTRTYTLSVTGS